MDEDYVQQIEKLNDEYEAKIKELDEQIIELANSKIKLLNRINDLDKELELVKSRTSWYLKEEQLYEVQKECEKHYQEKIREFIKSRQA